MAAPTISGIRAGIAKNLATVVDVQVSAYMLSAPTPPCIHVFPQRVEYDKAMGRGLDTSMFTVQAFVGLVSDLGAQQKLDEYLDPAGARSVKAAVETDKTLAGLVSSVRVTDASGYKLYVLEGSQGPVLGCEFTVEVLATGK